LAAAGPHVSWYTVETVPRYLEHAVDSCQRIRDGRELANVVNGYAGAQPTG
jgi:lactate dehydrogenase-like 2-hydroxyacid dehydrogenase